MQIQVNTDKHIEGNEALVTHVETVVRSAMRHVQDHLTRVEVHLSDENAGKPGADDMRCMLEARLGHHPPVAVTHHAGSVHQALDGAATKLKAALQATLERIAATQRRRPPEA